MPLSNIQKKCSKCLELKPLSLFNKAKTGIYGVRCDCKICQNKYNSKYRDEHREHLNLNSKIHRQENPSYLINYRKNNKDKRKIYIKERLENDKIFKLSLNVRNLIRNSFTRNGYSKTSKSCDILGCSFEEFKNYLETHFEPWMNWDNRGNWNGIPTEINTAWDIDHIIPVSTGNTEEEIIKLNHYSNLQPLCGYTNRFIKKNKTN
jgi:hypothetical protein